LHSLSFYEENVLVVSPTNHRENKVIRVSVVRFKTPESVIMLRELVMMHKEFCRKITVVRLTYEDSETLTCSTRNWC
jgi:hypothetical protein